MSCFQGRARLLLALLAMAGTASCSRLGLTDEQAQVTRAFESWKSAVINHQTHEALVYIPGHVEDYLNRLNLDTPGNSVVAPGTEASPTPGVDLLLRTALEKKVPPDLRLHLTLAALVQRISDRNLFNAQNIREVELGRIDISGSHATADVYYHGALFTALRLPFIKEGDDWKIDVMALLPYAEVLMRVDRAIKGETLTQQVDQLVSKLPSL